MNKVYKDPKDRDLDLGLCFRPSTDTWKFRGYGSWSWGLGLHQQDLGGTYSVRILHDLDVHL